MAAAKKHRRYKTPQTILRKTLAYFKANPDNWTRLRLRASKKSASDGVAFCALGGCFYFAEGRKAGNEAIRILAKALGMENADEALLDEVKTYVYQRNDGPGGKQRILSGLQKAVA